MDARKLTFLAAVLGDDGAQALRKAAERSELLEAALLPRAIVAWLEVASRFGHDGDIPGLAGARLAFRKAEGGLAGEVAIGRDVYTFTDASQLHVAAALAVALGADHERVGPGVRDLDLARLGKSIDLLVRARAVRKKLKARKDEGEPGEATEKIEPPGPAAKPNAPVAPAGPTKVQPQPGVQRPRSAAANSPMSGGIPSPKPKMQKTLKLTKHQAGRECPACGFRQFNAEQFTGCYCFRALAKGVRTSRDDSGGFVLEFRGPEWDQDSILTLAESFGGM